MNMSKKLVVAALALPLMLGTASAFAGGKDHGKDGRKQCGSDAKILHQLDLSDDQKAQMKTLRSATRDDMKEAAKDKAPKREAMKEQRQAMDEMILAESFDNAAALSFAKEMTDKRAEMMVKRMEKQHELFSILTPEQKEKFKSLKEDAGEHCKGDKPRHDKKRHGGDERRDDKKHH